MLALRKVSEHGNGIVLFSQLWAVGTSLCAEKGPLVIHTRSIQYGGHYGVEGKIYSSSTTDSTMMLP